MAIEYADEEQQQQQPPKNAASGYQWNKGNVFDSWDLNPLAQQIGGGANGVRDTLSTSRDAFLQPMMKEYRDKAMQGGWRADEGDEGLFNSEEFRNYVQTGQMPTNPNAPPSQQWAQSSSSSSGADDSGRRNELFDLLMQRIKAPTNPGADDPIIRRQADAFSAQQTRASRDWLADMAEKGGPYMNLTGESRLAAERAGQNSAGFESELIGREQDYRRDSVQKDLGLYGSLLSDAERTDLSRELGLKDLDERRAGRYMDNDQFLRELALRQWGMGDESDRWWSAFGTGQ